MQRPLVFLVGLVPAVAACLAMPPPPGGVPRDAANDGLDAEAGGSAFSCLGDSAPTMGDAAIVVAGQVSKLTGSGFATADAVTLEAHRLVASGGDTLVGTAGPTTSAGTFAIAITNPPVSTPVDGYLRATIASPNPERPTLWYPAQPWIRDQADVSLLMFSDAQLNNFLQPKLQDPARGLLVVVVTDCLDQKLNDATVSVTQGPTNTPVGEPIGSGLIQQVLPGTTFLLNVPVDDTTHVDATYQGMTFRAHTVKSIAETTTIVTIRPGF